jgi:3-(3-hydroxy-phenyl)propionate hydroxylase
MSGGTDEPVLVVGAGPAGLTAALGLRALGVPVTVLEAEPEDRVRPGSRALYVHRDSLRTFERVSPGLGAEVAGHGIQWSGRRTHYRGRPVFAKDHPPATGPGLPPYASLRQIDTEAHLMAACRAAGVGFDWSARVEKVAADDAAVEVHAADGRTWTGRYLVAADGARSSVRAAIGRAMVGGHSEAYHVVIDLADDPERPDPPLREFHYHHPGLGGRHVLVVPFAGGRQVDLQCRPDEDPDALLEPARLRGWLPEVVHRSYLDRVLWTSRYPFLQLVADSFVDDRRRVLLAGEAAHLFAPFGARGMNSGIADADAAAIAVATALAATTPERARSAIEDYDRTRRAAGAHNRDAAGSALAHMRPARRARRLRQRAAARVAPVLPRAGEWLEKAPYGPRTTATPTSTY